MARQADKYRAMTTKRFREMGRYYDSTEHINPFHIIKERDDLRVFRDTVLKFCQLAVVCESPETLKSWINALLDRTVATQRNTYFAGEKKDLFGFGDYLCADPHIGAVIVQATSASGHAEHRRKILRNDIAARWVGFENCNIELWSWRKSPQVKGSKRLVWKERVEIITLDMFKEFADAERSAGQSVCPS